MIKNLNLKMNKKWKYMVVLETKPYSNYGCRYDQDLKLIYLKRLSSNRYPCYYGRLELLDKNKKIIQQNTDKEDVFLITDRNIPISVAVPDFNLVKVGSFVCYDEKKQQEDNKSVYGLKGEVEFYPDYRIITELDNIRSFLISLRGSFKIAGFECENVSKKIRSLMTNMDWTTHKSWPEEFKTTFENDYQH